MHFNLPKLASLIFLMISCCNCTHFETTYLKQPFSYKFEDALETDNEICINRDTILYSKNTNGTYQIYLYNHKKSADINLLKDSEDLINPFIFNGKPCFIKRSSFGKNYSLVGSLPVSLNNKHFSRAYSSPGGCYVLLKVANADSLFLLSAKGNSLVSLPNNFTNFNSCSFFEQNNSLVISAGDKLWKVNLANLKVTEIITGLEGKKLNPSIYGDSIYYASYNTSGHYCLYSSPVNNSSGNGLKAHLLLQSSFDLRMPLRRNEFLYYIEVVNSEYLLRAKDLISGVTYPLTLEGVVYSFQIWQNSLISIYSDLQTPRTIKILDNLKSKKILSDTTSLKRISFKKLIWKEKGGVPAYELFPADTSNIKGVILYFHPGRINDDFSPRWDNMLMPLIGFKYVIIAPNPPSSSGYGRYYEALPRDSAIYDMADWYYDIKRRFPKLPVFFYGISSGCPLMEACVTELNIPVNGIISAFGLPYPTFNSNGTPCIYLLGKYDPVIPYKIRYKELTETEQLHREIQILTVDEGHWIQKPKSFYYFFSNIDEFMDSHQGQVTQ